MDGHTVVTNLAFVIYKPSLWEFALVVSTLHMSWIATVCGRLETRLRYSSTLGWNTFPVPTLTEKNKADLTRCAEDILLAREAHFPATIADLYDPDNMPADLREAHERNDEVLERIYIGRRFRNDTERLEKLFELYTKMTASPGAAKKRKGGGTRMTDEKKIGPLRLGLLRPQRQLDQGQRPRHAADAGARLREARRAISAHQVAAGVGQEPRAHVHRARQAAQSGAQAGDHRRAGEIHRRELPRRAADAISASGPTGPSRRNGTSATRPARTTAARSIPSARSCESDDKVLVCTHATFRFAVDKFGVEAFDDRLIAVDEFHHVSANPDNKLGLHLGQFIARDHVHIVAMTGSYFRGDAEAVLAPQDEAKFDTVTYTYYEQLNGYEYLKQLDIGYFFYSGSYADDILKVLDPAEKTIVHIPSVNSRESTKDKIREVEHIIEELGEWQGADPATGFQLVKTPEGRVLRIADLVDDDPAKRDRVSAALKDPAQKNNRDHVDIIIALGMAKEGFDWIWCEHALTVGYRSSLTEIVQIIGRATRDAPGKTRARFTNLIAEPDASEEAVTEAVNDTLKAIAASLLMEQVLAPRFEFKPKNPQSGPTPGFDYGEGGYDPNKCNVGFNEETGPVPDRDQGPCRRRRARRRSASASRT